MYSIVQYSRVIQCTLRDPEIQRSRVRISEKRQKILCGHCDQQLSKTQFYKHKRLYKRLYFDSLQYTIQSNTQYKGEEFDFGLDQIVKTSISLTQANHPMKCIEVWMLLQ